MLDWAVEKILRGAACLLQRMPLDAALALGVWGGRVVHFFRKNRGIAYLNLKAAFEGKYSSRERHEIARKSLENFGMTIIEVLRLPIVDPAYIERYTRTPDVGRIAEVLQKKRGLIFSTAHFGNWELLPVRACFAGYPMKGLYRPQVLKRVGDFLNELRTCHGTELIGRGAMLRDFIRALHQGNVVGIIADQAVKTGVPVEFFGRVTYAAQGPAAIAQRTGAPILHVFDVRENRKFHNIHILPEMNFKPDEKNEEEGIRRDTQECFRVLEGFIRQYPDMWLWDHKRWKYCLTKTVMVLTDGKAGHESQSRAVLKMFEELTGQERSEYQLKTKIVKVEYKNSFSRHLLAWLTPFVLPVSRGRLGFLKFFLKKGSYEAVSETYTDYVISCGSSLVPLNLLVSQENDAKNIVLMSPSFPFNLYKYHLAVLPWHDKEKQSSFLAKVRAIRAVFTDVALNSSDEIFLKAEGKKLAERLGLNGKRRLSFFVGGDSKAYVMSKKKVKEALDCLVDLARHTQYDILVTTSRRTSGEVSELLKEKLKNESLCRLLVIANESNIENVTYGMLNNSDEVFVTEESVSMISEAVSSGKKVHVLKVGETPLPKKFSEFLSHLENKKMVSTLAPHEIKMNLFDGTAGKDPQLSPMDAVRQTMKKELNELF